MAEEVKQDGQKTLVAFIVGLLIGGMLVWAFSGPTADAPYDDHDHEHEEEVIEEEGMEDDEDNETDSTEETAASIQIGDGEIVVPDQSASMSVSLESAIYPVSEGWIGVREYNNEQLGFILGVVQFSESQNLIPNEIILQRPTISGREYAVVIFTENGDSGFNLAGDVQIDTIFDTFIAE